MSEVEEWDNIGNWDNGIDLVNWLAARTFPPYDGAFFVERGRKIGVRVELYDMGLA